MHWSSYLPMTQKFGNSKGSSDLRSKNRRFYPLRTLLNLPLFNFFGVNGFFSRLFFSSLSTVPCDLQKSGEYAGYADPPTSRSPPSCAYVYAMIFQNHEKIYLHPAMLRASFSDRGCRSREEKKKRPRSVGFHPEITLFHTVFAQRLLRRGVRAKGVARLLKPRDATR